MRRDRLRGDHGVTAVEFALVAPLVIVLILGLLATAFRVTALAVADNAARKAVRTATLRSAFTYTTSGYPSCTTVLSSAQSGIPAYFGTVTTSVGVGPSGTDGCGAAAPVPSEGQQVTVTVILDDVPFIAQTAALLGNAGTGLARVERRASARRE